MPILNPMYALPDLSGLEGKLDQIIADVAEKAAQTAVDTLLTRLGTNADAAGAGTAFARLAQIAGYTDEAETLLKNSGYGLAALQALIGAASNTGGSATAGTLMAKENNVQALIGAANNTGGSATAGTLMAKVNALLSGSVITPSVPAVAFKGSVGEYILQTIPGQAVTLSWPAGIYYRVDSVSFSAFDATRYDAGSIIIDGVTIASDVAGVSRFFNFLSRYTGNSSWIFPVTFVVKSSGSIALTLKASQSTVSFNFLRIPL
jgi:hypothetical protein